MPFILGVIRSLLCLNMSNYTTILVVRGITLKQTIIVAIKNGWQYTTQKVTTYGWKAEKNHGTKVARA